MPGPLREGAGCIYILQLSCYKPLMFELPLAQSQRRRARPLGAVFTVIYGGPRHSSARSIGIAHLGRSRQGTVFTALLPLREKVARGAGRTSNCVLSGVLSAP